MAGRQLAEPRESAPHPPSVATIFSLRRGGRLCACRPKATPLATFACTSVVVQLWHGNASSEGPASHSCRSVRPTDRPPARAPADRSPTYTCSGSPSSPALIRLPFSLSRSLSSSFSLPSRILPRVQPVSSLPLKPSPFVHSALCPPGPQRNCPIQTRLADTGALQRRPPKPAPRKRPERAGTRGHGGRGAWQCQPGTDRCVGRGGSTSGLHHGGSTAGLGIWPACRPTSLSVASHVSRTLQTAPHPFASPAHRRAADAAFFGPARQYVRWDTGLHEVFEAAVESLGGAHAGEPSPAPPA